MRRHPAHYGVSVMCFGFGRSNPYLSRLHHWRWGYHTVAPVSIQLNWKVCIYQPYESTNDWKHNHNKTKHNKSMCKVYGMYCIPHWTLSTEALWYSLDDRCRCQVISCSKIRRHWRMVSLSAPDKTTDSTQKSWQYDIPPWLPLMGLVSWCPMFKSSPCNSCEKDEFVN